MNKNNNGNCILIYGNIGAGKSTLVNHILENKVLEKYKYICIDKIREDLINKNINYGEVKLHVDSEKEFLFQISNNKNIILETTACSKLFDRVKLQLECDFNLYYVYLDCENRICAERFYNRPYQVRPPFCKKLSVRNAILDLGLKQKKIKKDLIINTQEYSETEVFEIFKNNCPF